MTDFSINDPDSYPESFRPNRSWVMDEEYDDETRVDLGGGMVVRLSELLEDDE
jgi:hypothetical protein